MNIEEARAAIEAILASIPDDELPAFDRIEQRDDGKVVAKWGGTGYYLGTAKRNGNRDPSVHREDASNEAIVLEMVYRADKQLFDHNDNPGG